MNEARGGTRYIPGWGGAARPLIPLYPYTLIPLYPLYREKHTLAGRTSPLSPYKGVPPPPPGE